MDRSHVSPQPAPQAHAAPAEDAPTRPWSRPWTRHALSYPLRLPRALWDAVGQRASSSLTRRIVVLNLVGLIALLVGFLYLNQFRQGLIQARVQSLAIQGEIIAGAISTSASVDTDTIRVDPDKLLQQQAGEGDEEAQSLAFSLNPERVAPLLARLVTPTGNRARVYDQEGGLLFDTRTLFKRGDASRAEPAAGRPHKAGLLESAFDTCTPRSPACSGARRRRRRRGPPTVIPCARSRRP